MSKSYVIDASIGFSWVHPHQATEETDRLLDSLEEGAVVVVPFIWFLEVANALLVAVRRKKLTGQERLSALNHLKRLKLTVDTESPGIAFGTLSELAETHVLSIYDASYLELALRRQLPLASRDGALCKAAKRCGVSLL